MKKYLLAFSQIPSIGPVRLKKIENSFPSLEQAWNASSEEYQKTGLENSVVQSILEHREKIDPQKELAEVERQNIQVISQLDPLFPAQLKEISAAPFLLFALGNLEILSKKQIGVVGTRMPTAYGKMAAEKLSAELCGAGLTVTSGMAYGIDSVCHRAAVRLKKPTVAVLGSGLLEGRKNLRAAQIMDEILSGGGTVISEYPPFFPASKATFPARNRIISGLSLGVLVIEAGQKSGALITANYALSQNREVFAVPGSIFSDKSRGTNHLIQQGAVPTRDVNDILESLNFATSANPEKLSQEKAPQIADRLEKRIYDALSFEPLNLDKIAKSVELSPAVASAKISMLELQGLIKNVGGGRFIRS